MAETENAVAEKVCIACQRLLPLTAFYNQRLSKDGRTSYCVICSREKAAKWKRENPEKAAAAVARCRKKHPLKYRQSIADWQRANPERHNAANRRYQDRLTLEAKPGPDTLKSCNTCGETKSRSSFHVFLGSVDGRSNKCVECYTKASRRRLYDISEEQFETMWRDQEGLCVICEDFLIPFGKGTCVIDHDHDTGKVRGLLCSRCNLAIGHLRDDPESCDRAAAYLRRHAECR